MTDIPTPRPPEDLAPEELSLIENLPTERTATALLDLLRRTASVSRVPEDQLVQSRGVIEGPRRVALFDILDAPGGLPVGWLVASDAGRGVSVIRHGVRSDAETLYQTAAKWVIDRD